MKIIVQVKDGLIGDIFTILICLSLAGFTVWWGIYRNRFILFTAAPIFCAVLLPFVFVVFAGMRHPKTAILAIEGNQLVWITRTVENGETKKFGMPLQSIRIIELVLPRFQDEINSKNYSLAEMFIVDVHGNQKQVPTELWPGVHNKKIIAALKQERPELQVVEKIANREN